jgi:acyl-CoA reductase-like NAD-dependent aldehyde dehydrogenase
MPIGADSPATPQPFTGRLAGQPLDTAHTSARRDRLAVIDKHTGDTFAHAVLATAADVGFAIARAHDSRHAAAAITPARRAAVLRRLATAVRDHADDATTLLIREAGKCRAAAAVEVDRCIDTFDISAHVAERLNDVAAAPDRLGLIKPHVPGDSTIRIEHAPIGVCGFITPFNFPLNLAAHKIGPAIAAGCPFVLKPSDKAPLSALFLAELIAGTDYPADAWSILATTVDASRPLVDDERIAFFSFTGSDTVGWQLKQKSHARRVALELGGDAACLVAPPLSDAQLDHAAQRISAGGFGYAGQSCISTQRVLVHSTLRDDLIDRLVAHAERLAAGDPYDESTTISPLIDADAADRVERWINDAQRAGANIHTGGQRTGNTIAPTVISNAPPNTPVSRNEIFGPVVVVSTFDDLDDAIDRVNVSPFGLQAGVFTADDDLAERIAARLHVGGVNINDVPTLRYDAMPYGGVARSGVGREGPAFAAAEMIEHKAVVHRPLP